MSEVRGFNIPQDRYYWPEKHVWVVPGDDGSVVVGVTDVAQSLAHAIISALPKKVGRPAKKGRSLGTIESGKWVGPVTAPVSGEILETNPLLGTNPGIINTDPYGEGWYVKIMPSDWDAEVTDLVTGPDGVAAYEAFLEAEGIECE
ncbi:MAG: glycine cleavage system protein H [Acidimicrobiia bacterium]|nr:MAG: glycine cleavage system protein H [Acidimicrobiia bacterium]